MSQQIFFEFADLVIICEIHDINSKMFESVLLLASNNDLPPAAVLALCLCSA